MAFADLVNGFVSPAGAKAPTTTAGLFVSGSEKSVPLRLRAVRSTVHADTAIADATETLAFIADEDVSVVFKFPLPPRAAVYKLVATVGDRTITTEVKPRQEAQQEFDQAVSQGHTAVIAKQESSSQIFTLELGNLEAMQEAVVDISYLRVLDSVGGALEFVHTSTWTPPYLGSAGDQKRGPDTAANENPRFAPNVAYGLAYDITLLSRQGIKAVESPEPVAVTDINVEGQPAKRVTLSEQVADPSKDLTLLVELAPQEGAPAAGSDAGTGSVSVQQCERAGKTKTVALATFVPRDTAVASAADTNAPLRQELILIVDGSGSMSGAPIEQAREAALYFIKDLPVGRGLRFNIVAFGSHHITWSPSGCQEFTAATMNSAVSWVQTNVTANLGGTEILATFQAVYAMPITPGYSRHIIFLTDGGISGSEEEAVFKLLSNNGTSQGATGELAAGIKSLKDRVLGRGAFAPADTIPASDAPAAAVVTKQPAVLCLGIGHGVHRGLLDGMASRTGGVAQYVVEGESISRKVAFLKKAALGGPAAIHNPRLLCGGALVRAAPHVLPLRLFPGEPAHVLVEMLKAHALDDVSLQLKGTRGDGTDFTLALPLKGVAPVKGDTYAVLHAMCLVSGLLDGRSYLHVKPDGTNLDSAPTEEAVKAAVVELGCQEHLVTRHTSAVGVMLQRDPLDPAQVKKVEVPLATPHGADLFKQAPPGSGFRYGSSVRSRGISLFGSPAPSSCAMNTFAGSAGCAPSSFAFGSAAPASGSCAPAVYGSAAPAPVTNSSAAPTPVSFGSAAPANAGSYTPSSDGTAKGATPFGFHNIASTLEQDSKMFYCQMSGNLDGAAPPKPAVFGGFAPWSWFKTGSSNQSASFGPTPAAPLAAPPFASAAMGEATAMPAPAAFFSGGGVATDTAKSQAQDQGVLFGGSRREESASGLDECGQGKLSCRTPAGVMKVLNLKRGVEGYWSAGDAEVWAAVASQVEGAGAGDAAKAGKPGALSEDQWLTVLALAFLRKHCASERGVWEGMEQKAMAWLQAGWSDGS